MNRIDERWYHPDMGEISLKGFENDFEGYFKHRTRLLREGWKPVKMVIQLPSPDKIMGFDIIINSDLPMNEFLIGNVRYRILKDGSIERVDIV